VEVHAEHEAFAPKNPAGHKQSAMDVELTDNVTLLVPHGCAAIDPAGQYELFGHAAIIVGFVQKRPGGHGCAVVVPKGQYIVDVHIAHVPLTP
jgi:hypothetical protein